VSANEVDPVQSPPGGVSDAPRGNSAVEIAARKGFGPLSPLVRQAWHGDSKPCVSCGQLVRRSATQCDACGENLTEEMLTRMRDFAGPWFVLEHVRPFPGVTCERLVRQVRRGVLTRMTIVRGPNTFFQWRFAGETPGLCKFLGVCWSCQSRVRIEHDRCPSCGVELAELTDDAREAGVSTSRPATPPAPPPRLRELSHAVQSVPRPARLDDDVPRVGRIRASWIVVAIVIVLVSVLVTVVNLRDADLSRSQAEPQQTLLGK
jgi:RNA polymerase subunit RPABC4/transcription elongation factor Spt4